HHLRAGAPCAGRAPGHARAQPPRAACSPRMAWILHLPDSQGVVMLKIMLLNDGDGRAASLRDTLAAAGVQVVAERAAGIDLAEAIARLAPDVVLIDADAAARDTLEDICVASESTERPVVMFTDDDNRETIRAALRAG